MGEESEDLVVRAYETFGLDTVARIELPLTGRCFEASFAPGEIRTFLVPHDQELPVRGVSLLELDPDPGEGAVYEVDGDSLG